MAPKLFCIPDLVIKILRQDTPQGVQNIEQAAEQLKLAIKTSFDKCMSMFIFDQLLKHSSRLLLALQEMKAIQEKIDHINIMLKISVLVLQSLSSDYFPLIVNEQNFMADFFHLTKKDSKLSCDSEVFLKDLDDNEILNGFILKRAHGKTIQFILDELCVFIDYGCKLDAAQIVGIIVSIEKLMNEDERLDYNYVIKVNEQLKAIEDTKVTSKRRKVIVLFIRIFPVRTSSFQVLHTRFT
ncbi:629_t:CDS:2 [Cetraspora pellucida]|uniref:629_t:CDS:1 n=1 Tax=Cetraspora pellucida TaxID=1433469 RepID=A0A9N9DF80_9GLOM|nr:629_t:CDS:2 [Cetraspora pellucida]